MAAPKFGILPPSGSGSMPMSRSSARILSATAKFFAAFAAFHCISFSSVSQSHELELLPGASGSKPLARSSALIASAVV